jgi:hypothetical protein
VLRHVGQRAAQLAVWPTGERVTRAQWRAARMAGLVAQHIVLTDGQVIVTCFTAGWYDPSAVTLV